jgi:D-tyrosyl-tRNA(Tyr) deacylase
MIALIQRVDEARVFIDGGGKSSIGKGLLVFLGVEGGDDRRDADYLLDKIIHLRIFEDHQGKMNLSLDNVAGEMMVVSQFTLAGDCRKGRRPSFVRAEEPEKARSLYNYFIERGRRIYGEISSGEFQAAMKIHLVNNGPVTLILHSRPKEMVDHEG